jgi:hypothetical protein
MLSHVSLGLPHFLPETSQLHHPPKDGKCGVLNFLLVGLCRGTLTTRLVDHFERRAKFLSNSPRNGNDQFDISVAAIDDVDVPSGFGVRDYGWRYRDLFYRSTFWMLANCGENPGSQFLTRNGLPITVARRVMTGGLGPFRSRRIPMPGPEPGAALATPAGAPPLTLRGEIGFRSVRRRDKHGQGSSEQNPQQGTARAASCCGLSRIPRHDCQLLRTISRHQRYSVP